MVTTASVFLAYVLPVIIAVFAVFYVVLYIFQRKKRRLLAAANPSLSATTSRQNSGIGNDGAGTNGTDGGPQGGQRRHRYRRRRRLRNFLAGRSGDDADSEEHRALFGSDANTISATSTNGTSTTRTTRARSTRRRNNGRNGNPRTPRAPPPTRGKDDEEWADAYNRVLRDNPYALTLFELDAMFPAQKFKREKHDLYRLARRTSMRAREELHRRSTLQSVRNSSLLPASPVAAAAGSIAQPRPLSAQETGASGTPGITSPSIIGSRTGTPASPNPFNRPHTPISQTGSPRPLPSDTDGFTTNANFSDVSLSSTTAREPTITTARPASMSTVGAVSAAGGNRRVSNIHRNISLPSRSAPATPAPGLGPRRAQTFDDGHHDTFDPNTHYDSYNQPDLERGDQTRSREPIIDEDDSDYEWVYEEYTDDSDAASVHTTDTNWLQTVTSLASFFSPLGSSNQNTEYNDMQDLNPRARRQRRLRRHRSLSADGHLNGGHRNDHDDEEEEEDSIYNPDLDPSVDLVSEAAAVSRNASLKRMSAASASSRTNRHTLTMPGTTIRHSIHPIPENGVAASSSTDSTMVSSSGPSSQTDLSNASSSQPPLAIDTALAASREEVSTPVADGEAAAAAPASETEAAAAKETAAAEEEPPHHHNIRIVDADDEFVFCPICQGTIRELEGDSDDEDVSKKHKSTLITGAIDEEPSEQGSSNPTTPSTSNESTDTPTATLLDDEDDDNDHIVRLLSCNHVFHDECIRPWLTTSKALCPLCKRDFRNEIPVEVLKAESV